jgi:integrase
MRRRGSGSVTTMPDGRKRVQLWVDGKRRSLGIYDTEEEAKAILSGAAVAQTRETHNDGVLLRQWGTIALDRREQQGLRGVEEERSRWDAHVADADIAELPVRSIVRADVQRWLDRVLVSKARGSRAKRGKTISRRTAANALTILRAVLEDAVSRGVAATNAADGVRLPRARGKTHDEWTYLTPHEQLQLLSTVPAAIRPAVQFAIVAGLRQGEQWSLELVDVHVDAEVPHVVVRYGGPSHMPTKNGKPRRVDLLPAAVDAVRAQLGVLVELEKVARKKGKRGNPLGLLFPTIRGSRRQKGAPTGWETWVERAIGRNVRWHDLRHTCASSLVAGWWGRAWTLTEVCALLGHTSIKVTERYAHLAGTITEDAVRATVEATGESTTSAHDLAALARKYLSHLRDLNSRPTVYESGLVSNKSSALDLPRAHERAVAALEAVASRSPHAAARMFDVVEVVLGLRVAAVERVA